MGEQVKREQVKHVKQPQSAFSVASPCLSVQIILRSSHMPIGEQGMKGVWKMFKECDRSVQGSLAKRV